MSSPVTPAVMRAAPVTMDCSQPVEPAPVETMMPLDDWSSACPPYSSR
jgi:hypothetical protein